MRIIATLVKAKQLEPGDLFSTAGQEYWHAVCLPKHETGLPVGERVFIRTPTPCPPDQADEPIYKLQILTPMEEPVQDGFFPGDAFECYHWIEDSRCENCPDGYPKQCSCGGLIHAQVVDENAPVREFCDKCGFLFNLTPTETELVSSELYSEVMRKNAANTFTLNLNPVQVGMLHGALRLMLLHPEVRLLSKPFHDMAVELKQWCLDQFRVMGFSDAEVEYLDREFK